MAVDITSWIVFITLLLIYGITLGWQWLRPEEQYGNYAYFTALLPANFAWYLVMESDGPGNGINGLGAAAFLVTLWFAAFVRDIFAVRAKKKDFDDALLYLLGGILLQLIAYGVLPFNGVFPALNDNGTGATATVLTYWIMPNMSWPNYDLAVLLWFRIIITALALCAIAPIVLGVNGKYVPAGTIIIVTLIFALPLAFVLDAWSGVSGFGSGRGIAIGSLLLVMFFIFLLWITRKR
ncbi:MAG TPA: hypothetical protein VKK79_15075 [Candidatus Lokiarchaeia archaeon]|nr:hypothetical protein [Candidatus Lokiarchaeia archaeon]